jgi:hypothetical protein
MLAGKAGAYLSHAPFSVDGINIIERTASDQRSSLFGPIKGYEEKMFCVYVPCTVKPFLM